MTRLLSMLRSFLAPSSPADRTRNAAPSLLGGLMIALIVPFVLPGASHAQFTQQKNINQPCTACFATSVHAADLDGDTDPDIISASTDDDKIAWYENTSSGFSSQQTISTNATKAQSVYAADLDDDNDLDVLSASRKDDKIAWYENTGSGFSSQKVISTNAATARSVYAADLNGDQYPDVLSASQDDDKIAWYENTGGSFSSQKTISTNADAARSVYAANLDGDSDMDVLSASLVDNKIAWYENTSSGFSTQNVITTSAQGARSVYAAKLDGDSDMDVLSASSADDKIAWYENTSTGFSSQKTISTNASGTESVYAAKLDSDSDLDVLSANDNKIAWYENTSSGFSSQKSISTNADAVRTVHAADLDGDNDADPLSASGQDDKIAWYENQLDTNGIFAAQSVINALPNALKAQSVYAANLDSDSDLDALSASAEDDKIAWYENTSSGFSTQNVISTNADGARSVTAANLDGDTDMDVLSASSNDNTVAWYENLNTGGFSSQTTITTSANGAQSVDAADLDDDNDMDILSASANDNTVAWYENNGANPPSFTKHSITTSATGASDVHAADCNEDDGNIDVLVAASGDDRLSCFENDGNSDPSFGIQDDFTTNADGASSVNAADLNGDTAADVLSASRNDDKIAWYEQEYSGYIGSQNTISTSATFARSVYPADLDTDGDSDVLAAYEGTIARYKNTSSGFSTENKITTNTLIAESVFAADVDQDGDPDVLSASSRDHKIAWYENKTPPVITSATTADSDDNGQIDEITIQFSETVDITDGNASDGLPGYSVNNYTIANADYGDTNVSSLTLTLIESGAADTGVTPLVTYNRGNNTVVNEEGKEQLDGDSQTPTDGAAPVVSSVSLGNDGSDNLTLSFNTNEKLNKGNGAIRVDVDGPNTGGWEVFQDADFSETDNGGSFTYTLTTNSSYNDGDGTYTASVTSAYDLAGNDGASGESATYTLDTTAPTVSSVSLSNDGSGNLAFSFDTDEQLDKGNSAIKVTVDAPSAGTDWKTFADGDFSENDNGDGTFTYTLSTTQVYSDGDGTYTAKVDDALDPAGNDGADGSQSDSYTLDTTAPTVSNVTLGNDGSGNLAFSFDTDEQLDKGNSAITVTVDAPSAGTDWKTFSDADFSETDNGGSFTYDLSVSSSYSDGAGTYTAAVDDAVDADGNDGADGSQTASYTFTANVALVDGRDGEAYSSPSPTPGTKNNPVGRFKLSADVSGSALSAVTVTQEGSTPTGVNAIELWRSGDNSFDTSGDNELASKSYSDNVSFSVSTSIPTGGAYFFVVVDLASDASGDYNPKITSESDISFTEGTLSSVNGTSTSSFTDAYLSNSSTPLPVELARFDAARSEEGVALKWRTASEKNNAGFRVQRQGADGTWTKVGWVEGSGTRSKPKTYRFSDEDLPYAADTLHYRLKQVDTDGTTATSQEITVARRLPNQIEMLGTFPNPMRNRATLRYALPEKTNVSIALYDVMGRQVRTVVEGRQKPGRKQLQVDGSGLSSGVYFLRLNAGEQTKTQRLTVVR